jgi:hypothetical protein
MVRLAFDVGTADIDELIIAAPDGYHRVPPGLLTQADIIEGPADFLSGGIEPVLVGAPTRLWVAIGANHPDHKPVGRTAWRFEDIEPHWGRLILRSYVTEHGRKMLYQEGPLASLRPPRELVAGWRNGDKRLPAGVAMFCGTIGARGGLRPSARIDMELDDPVLGRKLAHGYHVQSLPIVS